MDGVDQNAEKERAVEELRSQGEKPFLIGRRSTVLGSVAYLGAQLLALGVLLQAVFDLPGLGSAVAIGVLVLVAYSVLGGMIAGVYTDVLQGAIMLVAAVAVHVQAVRTAGGWGELTRSIIE